MGSPNDRRRPHPSDRFAGSEHLLDVDATLRALRAEAAPGTSGHQQITLLHRGPVRLVLFAFDAGGRMPEHRAPGWVTIQVLRGALRVTTPEARHELVPGRILTLAPDVPHEVDAGESTDMLLGIYPLAPVGSAAPLPNEPAG